MVCRCVAAGCSHTNKDGISLYKFPKDSSLRKKWADQVEGPEINGRQLTLHSYAVGTLRTVALNQIASCLKLWDLERESTFKANAIPTIFEKPASLKRRASASESQVPKRRRIAYEKRERSRISSFVV